MATKLEQYQMYLLQDHFECNLMLNRINALVTSQTLFVAAASFLYSTLQNKALEQKVAVTAVSAIASTTAIIALMAIFLGGRILRRWHRHGVKLIDSDKEYELKGCHLEPRRDLPDWTHTISMDAFGLSLPLVFFGFWVLAICWVHGWLG